MGLTKASTGINARDNGLTIKKHDDNDIVVALAGNPNVGKSTLFNAITGMKQHTGNWPGKTVANARGYARHNGQGYVFVDIPGSYSLLAHSAEEEVAGDFICSGVPDVTVVVCGASCLERSLKLVLQISEVSKKMIVCVNLIDEAAARGIEINFRRLSEGLGVPVIPVCARNGIGIRELMDALDAAGSVKHRIDYGEVPKKAIELTGKKGCEAFNIIEKWDDGEPAVAFLKEKGVDRVTFADMTAAALARAAAELAGDAVTYKRADANAHDRRLDKIFTSRLTGFPVMALLLALIFWITITGANIPSRLLSGFLFGLEKPLFSMLKGMGVNDGITGMLVFGMYRVPAWVVSVMLPPMAIFFPLFTVLEDSGYLPRVAFNLDRCFKKCRACGKQALTMCLGY